MARQRNASTRAVRYSSTVVADARSEAKKYMDRSQKILAEAIGPVPVYEGYVTDPRMIDFCKAVRKEVPSIKFVPILMNTGITIDVKADSGEFALVSETRTKLVYGVSAVVGYFDDDPYASVKLVVGDGGTRIVSSRTIRNNKYKNISQDFYTAHATTLPAAMKAFKKHFKRTTPEEVAGWEYGSVVAESASHVRTMREAAFTELKNLYEHASFVQYMRSLARRDTPPEYVTEAVTVQAGQYIQAVDAALEAQNNPRMLYIQISTVGGTTYSVVPYDSTTTAVTARRAVAGSDDRLEEMFPGALGRIAVLAMTETTMFVSGVGMRLNENCFWVMQ